MSQEPIKPWANWDRCTVALEGEPGVTLEELYQAFRARLVAEDENKLNRLSPQERAIAERMGL